jgi:hypothetical protein
MGPQYTSCVEPAQFRPVNQTLVGVLLGVAAVGGIAAVLLNPGLILVSIALVVQALRYTLDWMLNGKLVCRHRDHAATDCVCSDNTTTVCAIGRVVDTEAVRALCTILQTIFAPLALLAALAAWALSSSGKIADALEGGGTVGPKDDVIVRGRWAYDGGHEGWNEIHATRVVQKVENIPGDAALFDDFLKRWCTRLPEVPNADPNGTRPQDANAAATYDAQARPENSWVLHPAVDGCLPVVEPGSDGGLH